MYSIAEILMFLLDVALDEYSLLINRQKITID